MKKTIILLLFALSPFFASAQSKLYFTVTGQKNAAVLIGANNFSIGVHTYDTLKQQTQSIGWKNNIVWDIVQTNDNLYISSLDGVQRSNDNGKTWEVITDWHISESLCLETAGNNIFLGTSKGIWKSADEGQTWQEQKLDKQSVGQHYINFLLAQKESIWACTADGLLQSKDSGETWEAVGFEGREVHQIAVCPTNSSILVCATEDSGIFLTKDAGKSWTQINQGLYTITFYTVAFDALNPQIIYAAGYQTGIYKTENWGEKWLLTDNALAKHTIYRLTTTKDQIWVGSLDGGLWKSNDSASSFTCQAVPNSKVWQVKFLTDINKNTDTNSLNTLRSPPTLSHATIHDTLQLTPNSRLVLDYYKKLPYRADIFRAIAKLKLRYDTATAYQIIDSVLAKPQGDMFLMYPITALYLHTQHLLPFAYHQKIQNFFVHYTPLRGNTENHWLMYYTSIYLMSNQWKSDEIWFNGKTTAENLEESQTWLHHWLAETQKNGISEFNSPFYGIWYLTPLVMLVDFTPDVRLRNEVQKTLHFLLKEYAHYYLDGFFSGAYSRIYEYEVLNKRKTPMSALFNFLLGNKAIVENHSNFLLQNLVIWSLSSYKLPEELRQIAIQKTEKQVIIKNYRPKKQIRYAKTFYPKIQSYVYQTPHYALSSLPTKIAGLELHSWHLSWESNQKDEITTLFSLHPYFSEYDLASTLVILRKTAVADVATGKPFYTKENKWIGGSPYEQLFQEKNSLLALYDFSSHDVIYKHFDLFFPHSLEKSEQKGWIFGEHASVWVALYPLKPYQWIAEKNGFRLRSQSPKNGFVLYTASPKDYHSFADFQEKIIKKSSIKFDENKMLLYFRFKKTKLMAYMRY